MKHKKSSIAFIWISSLIIIFALGVLYLSINRPLAMMDEMLSANMDSEFVDTYNKIYGTFQIWPLILIFGVLLGAVLLSTRQPDSETRGFL